MALMAYLVWIVLNGKVTLEILLIGLPIAAAAWLFARSYMGWSAKKELCLYRLLPQIVSYLALLVWEVVKASVSVMKYILAGDNPDGVMVSFQSGLRTPIANTVLANSITLTPGTITVSEKNGRFEVCCLCPAYAEGIEEICFIGRLRAIEQSLAAIMEEKA